MVIRGREGTFCSGFDLDELQGDFIGETGLTRWPSVRRGSATRSSARQAVRERDEATTAGGFEILINCDFSIAAEDAKIGDFHMRRALFGGAGPIYRVPRILESVGRRN
jgi:enoyl-CoA hydratase/carnithine racemase